MMRKIVLMVTLLLFAVSAPVFAQSLAGKKVLAVDAYHEGYPWSDGIVKGVQDALKGSGAELKIVRMDTKRNTAESFAKEAGQKVKALIESYHPDVVIVADDNATKHILMPFYKNATLPFVFCGINWDASIYGLPYKNATGMLEVALITQLIDTLKGYSKGTRVGLLTSDVETEHKDTLYYKKLFNINFSTERYVKTFAAWKDAYKSMQDEVDIIIVSNNAGISGWNEAEAASWAQTNAKVPTGTIYDFMMPYAMVGMAKSAEEQGIWAAQTALKILGGTSPASIEIAKNKKEDLMLNVKIASKAGIVFKPALVSNAKIIK
jgi:ABC-type uncharacterized transport system substrate-binding protein